MSRPQIPGRFAVEISFALRKEVEVARIEPINTRCCLYCNSANIVKDVLSTSNLKHSS